MRELIMQAIIADPVLNGMGIADDNSFAVDVDTPEYRPFLQLRWGRNEVGLAQTQIGRRTVTIWVHDVPGDYTKIDAILTRIRLLLPTLDGADNGLGFLMAAEWAGDSEDLADDGHKTIARWTSFTLIGTGQ